MSIILEIILSAFASKACLLRIKDPKKKAQKPP